MELETATRPEPAAVLRRTIRVGNGTRVKRGLRSARVLIGPLVVLLAWQFATATKIVPGDLLPTPVEVVEAWWTWIFGSGGGAFEGSWASDALATGVRVWIGFAIAAVLGIALGVLIGYSKLVAQLVDPVVQLLRPMPAVAWVPLAIVFFGFSPSATVFLIVYGAFFPIVLNTAAGVSRTQRSFVMVGRMLGATRWQMLRRIVYPAALPAIFTGLRLGIGIAWILGIVGELIAVRSGLGYSLMQAYSVFRYDVIIAAMVSFGVLGAASDWLVLRAEKHILRWREGYDAEKS